MAITYQTDATVTISCAKKESGNFAMKWTVGKPTVALMQGTVGRVDLSRSQIDQLLELLPQIRKDLEPQDGD